MNTRYLLLIFLSLLSAVVLAQPSNDFCGNATLLTLSQGSGSCQSVVSADNTSATDSGIAHSCDSYQGGDIWYKAVVPSSGQVTLTAAADGSGSQVAAVMEAYDGCSGMSIGCSATGLLVLSGLTPGTTIAFAIWDAGNDNFGTFNICALDPNPVAPQALGGLRFNYQLNANGSVLIGNFDLSDLTEEPRMRAGACPSQSSMSQLVIADADRTLTTCNTSTFFNVWSGNCASGCSDNWQQKLLSRTNEEHSRIDLSYWAWEFDPGRRDNLHSIHGQIDVSNVLNQNGNRVEPGIWSDGTHDLRESGNNPRSVLSWWLIWRYTAGDDKATAINLQTLDHTTLTHFNSVGDPTISGPATDDNMRYTDVWSGQSNQDIFYQFTVPIGGRRVSISSSSGSSILRLLDSTTDGISTGEITNGFNNITRDLCAGTYFIVVEGQFGAFDLTIDPDPIPVTGGNITSSISTACIDVALGPISGSFGTGTDISYQWFKQIEGQNAQSIVGATDRELTASQAGTMPADTNVNWVRFYRETLACGGNNQPSNTITINKQSSDINAQSITYQPTSQITTAGPYTIPPNLALTRNIGMFTGPVATGSPGPTTSTWEIITPTNSSWTIVATGTSWTPHLLAGGQPFSASGVYRVLSLIHI